MSILSSSKSQKQLGQRSKQNARDNGHNLMYCISTCPRNFRTSRSDNFISTFLPGTDLVQMFEQNITKKRANPAVDTFPPSIEIFEYRALFATSIVGAHLHKKHPSSSFQNEDKAIITWRPGWVGFLLYSYSSRQTVPNNLLEGLRVLACFCNSL